jgi:hypothetical protein
VKIQPAQFLAGLAIFLLVAFVASNLSTGEAVVSLAAAMTDKVETTVKLSASGAEVPVETVQSPLPDGVWNAIASVSNWLAGVIALVASWLSKGLHLVANLLQFASDRIEAMQAAQEPEPTDEIVEREALEDQFLETLDSDDPNPDAIIAMVEALTNKRVRLTKFAGSLQGVPNANVTTQAKESTSRLFSR